MLKPEEVEEFRQLWKKEFNEELTFEQAEVEAKRLITSYTLILEGERKGFDSSSGSPERKLDQN